MDLELATNEELIEELMRRQTFRGVVAWQLENVRNPDEHDTKWRWRSNGLGNVAEILAELKDKIVE